MTAEATRPGGAFVPGFVAGIDFTSRPTPRKPVMVAIGRLDGDGRTLRLDRIDAHPCYESFAAWLRTPGPWVGAFDFPFGLPRELVHTLGWPRQWLPLVRHYAALSRDEIRATFAAFCAARPAGTKFAHRGCDALSGASSSMKWINPPVAFMLHAGVPLLLDAGLHLPAVHAGDESRVALEGYPGLLAREVLGPRRSYKNDAQSARPMPADDPRRAARRDLVDALERGRTRLNLRLALDAAERASLIDDPTADRLDAVLCLLQAAWAANRPNWGLPDLIDPLEGWIVTAGTAS